MAGMHRSLLSYLRRHIRNIYVIKATENGSGSIPICVQRVLKSPPPAIIFTNSLHTSLKFEAGGDKPKSKSPKKKNNRLDREEEQLHSAAVDAAKSLPGDWTQIANELMARLSVQVESPPEDSEKEPSTAKSLLLSTMKVGRSFEMKKSGSGFRQDRRDTVQDKQIMRKRLSRKSETFKFLYGQQRLGIFDGEKLKAKAMNNEEDVDEVNLWQVVSMEKTERFRGALPKNGFEEMIKWTKKGRMWNFPVDNEEDMHEERRYKFHDHVFLSHHLEDFPSDGPLRRFMDLVILGLSKNPWISAPEKVEHIRWYADYFREKQKLLETSIGDKARMKQS